MSPQDMLPSHYVREDDDWGLQVLRITILVGNCQPRLAARVEGSDQTRKLYQMYCFNVGFTILPIPDGMLPSVFETVQMSTVQQSAYSLVGVLVQMEGRRGADDLGRGE